MNTTTYSTLQEVPHINSIKKSWSLFYPNALKIALGALTYLLAHPIRGWFVLYARLYCIFAPYPRRLKVPEGFYIRGWWQIYVYAQLFIERTLFHRRMCKEFASAYRPIVLDVGANIGMFSQWLGQYNIKAIFYSFEPLLEHFSEHRRILMESFRDVVLENQAVSSQTGYAHLAITSRVALDPSQGRQVKVTSLDDYYTSHRKHLHLPIFLLKIDTDGSNLKVLEGARTILGACRFVLIEKESDYGAFFQGWTRHDLGADFLYEQPKQHP